MDLELLKGAALFSGMTAQEIAGALRCLSAAERTFEKGEFLHRAGEHVTTAGVVLEGAVSIECDDFWGGRSVLGQVGPGGMFAEAYACAPETAMMVNVIAVSPCRILFLNVAGLLAASGRCVHAARVIRNLLLISAQKNLSLSRRMFYTSHKTIRERLLAYLTDELLRQGGGEVLLPFNRQELADYLNVERSALSAEIGKMRRDGVLEAERNRFRLLRQEG